MHLTFSLAAVAVLGTASALPGDYGHAWKSGGSYAWGTGSVGSGSVATASSGTGPASGSKSKPTGYGSGVPHGSGSVSVPVTETVKVYTTTTVCPVTTTGWENNTLATKTTLTTSTITVTSCAGGCHGAGSTTTATFVGGYPSGGHPGKPSSLVPVPYPTGGHPGKPYGSGSGSGSGSVSVPVTVTETTKTIEHPTSWATGTAIETVTLTYPTTVISTITSFVPCSTPIFSESQTTYFSTWLTVTHLTTTYKTTTTSCYTLYPSPTATASATVIVAPGVPDTPVSGTVVDATTTATTVWGEASGTCAPAETVYSTVVSYVTVYGGDHAPSATASPLKPGSSFTWFHGAGGHAKPSGAANGSGSVKPTGR